MARIFLTRARLLAEPTSSIAPPLGLMYLAAVLRQAGHDVHIHDMGSTCNNMHHLRQTLLRSRPHVMGISALQSEVDCLGRIAGVVRECFPAVPVVVGGALASSDPLRCLNIPGVDYVVLGEGERTMVELVQALGHQNGIPTSIAGIGFLDDHGEVRYTPPRPLLEDLDLLPLPAWDLVNVDFYQAYSAANICAPGRFPVFSSRGCPCRCVYCHSTLGKSFRGHSPQRVVEEIQHLKHHYGAKDIAFLDDIFNFDQTRMREILRRIIRADLGLTLSFPNALRPDMLDRELIALLREAGTRVLVFAVETSSPRLQRLIGKRLQLDKARRNIEYALAEGLFTGAYFMLGFPTETYEEARNTVCFALESDLHTASFSRVLPFPGTELFAMCGEIIRERSLDLDVLDAAVYSRSSLNLSAMTDRQLTNLHRTAYLKFYGSPSRVMRVWSDFPYGKRLLINQSRYVFEAVMPAWLRWRRPAEYTPPVGGCFQDMT